VQMPGAGLEPARDYSQGILSPLRLPISPPGRGYRNIPGQAVSVSRRTPFAARVLHVTGIRPYCL
jgi:hypothetical protein